MQFIESRIIVTSVRGRSRISCVAAVCVCLCCSCFALVLLSGDTRWYLCKLRPFLSTRVSDPGLFLSRNGLALSSPPSVHTPFRSPFSVPFQSSFRLASLQCFHQGIVDPSPLPSPVALRRPQSHYLLVQRIRQSVVLFAFRLTGAEATTLLIPLHLQ